MTDMDYNGDLDNVGETGGTNGGEVVVIVALAVGGKYEKNSRSVLTVLSAGT